MCSGPLSRRSFFRNGCSTLWTFTFSLSVDILPSSVLFSYRTACFLLPAFPLFRRILMPIRLSGVFHAHLLFQNLCIALAHWGLRSFYPLLQSGNLIPVFAPAPLSLGSCSYLSPITFSSLPVCCLAFSLKWRLMRYWRELLRLSELRVRTSHRRPPSCSRFATWLPS